LEVICSESYWSTFTAQVWSSWTTEHCNIENVNITETVPIGDSNLYQVSQKRTQISKYEGVSKSPRTILITRKSLVVHEFPARVCCGGVL